MYKLIKNGVSNKETGACITKGGYGWQEYQEWLKEGNTPEPEYTQEQLDSMEVERDRLDKILEARDNSGIKRVTIEQAHKFIDNQLDSANTATQKVEAIRTILKKMIPFLLN